MYEVLIRSLEWVHGRNSEKGGRKAGTDGRTEGGREGEKGKERKGGREGGWVGGTDGRRDRGTEGPRDGGTEGNNLQVNVLDAAIQKDGLVVAPLVKTYLHIFHYIYAVSRC